MLMSACALTVDDAAGRCRGAAVLGPGARPPCRPLRVRRPCWWWPATGNMANDDLLCAPLKK